jgi:uncharacterized protein (TIGR03437 family)
MEVVFPLFLAFFSMCKPQAKAVTNLAMGYPVPCLRAARSPLQARIGSVESAVRQCRPCIFQWSVSEIFTQTDGSRGAVAVSNGSSFNSPSNAAAWAHTFSFWATGQTAAMGGCLCPVLPVTVTIGGVNVDVVFAAVIYPGVLQINVRIPDAAPSGDAVSLCSTRGAPQAAKWPLWPSTDSLRL